MNDLYPMIFQNLRQEILLYAPFVGLLALNVAANLKKEHRFRQFPMPVVAIIYCMIAYVIANTQSERVMQLASFAIDQIPMDKVNELSGFMSGFIQESVDVLKNNQSYIAAIGVNTTILVSFITFKGICIAFFTKIFEKKNQVLEAVIGTMYEFNEEDETWHLRKDMYQARAFMKVFYYTGLILAVLGMMTAKRLYDFELVTKPYFPAFFVLVIGEIYFLLDAIIKPKEEKEEDTVETKDKKFLDFSSLRAILRKLFNDKLSVEDTTVDQNEFEKDKIKNYLENLENGRTVIEEGYAKFLRKREAQKLPIDVNYANSGLNLLRGQSVLFNNPFFYDAIPYVPYAMNRTLLRRRKILIILGRHGLEEEVIPWVKEGLTEVTHVEGMWRVGVLTEKESTLDVGIIVRSDVHNAKLHEVNKFFFEEVEMVIIMEPSKLITTAQIGLNSIIRYCRKQSMNKRLVFCSFDKNCDGLVDSLSHILMTSLVEVTATIHHRGVSSYMSWDGDSTPMQHRLLPNLSRYMGFGTELSLVALKNHIETTEWYGGEAFPVLDVHWIADQYYYDLMKYAGLPAEQSKMDEVMKYSPNMYSSKIRPEAYITVEDESCNMFEVQREFSTRFSEQGFINIISPAYMLKDYMAENSSVFTADPKAIPYICADYSHTRRNVMLRLCLRMCTGKVYEYEIKRELNLLSIPTVDPIVTFWIELCNILSDNPENLKNYQEIPLLIVSSTRKKDQSYSRSVVTEKEENGTKQKKYDYAFDIEVVKRKKEYSFEKGEMVNAYSILDPVFERLLLGDLQSAQYISEDEQGGDKYLGSEILGLLFQKYLPGQFFVFNGKYYEMVRTSANGKIIVRRASDHINGRKEYRQVRHYSLDHIRDSEVMGDIRDMGDIKLARASANITIQTKAYWDLDSYNDFESGRKREVNDIPARYYRNKSILKLRIKGASENELGTLCLLIQEVLRTILAENAPYIAVVTKCDMEAPLTYSVETTEIENGDTIYFLEDSQLDIGLLDAIERNVDRILGIVCDYLEWNDEQLNLSSEDEEDEEETNDSPALDEEEDELKKLGWFKRFLRWLKRTLHPSEEERQRRRLEKDEEKARKKRLKEEAKLAKQKAKDEKKAAKEAQKAAKELEKAQKAGISVDTAVEAPSDSVDNLNIGNEDMETAEGMTEAVITENDEDAVDAADSENTGVSDPADSSNESESSSDDFDDDDDFAADGDEPEEDTDAEAVDAENAEADSESSDESKEEKKDETGSADEEDSNQMQEQMLFDLTPSEDCDSSEVQSTIGDDDVSFEGEEGTMPGSDGVSSEIPKDFKRKPYSERYYLRYGGFVKKDDLKLDGVKKLLIRLHYDNSAMKQTRKGINTAFDLENSIYKEKKGKHFCSFCGEDLSLIEYDVLKDGRERCANCSKTAIRDVKQFNEMYQTVRNDLKLFYDVEIDVPIHIKVVNAKKIEHSLKKGLVSRMASTGTLRSGKNEPKKQGRTVGLAIRKGKEYTILMENGAPKLISSMTLVHEMTHIWQYINWDDEVIRRTYPEKSRLEIYEGMAKWSEIQYMYLKKETALATKEEMITLSRNDEYGHGFERYIKSYPLRRNGSLSKGKTPFGKIPPLKKF